MEGGGPSERYALGVVHSVSPFNPFFTHLCDIYCAYLALDSGRYPQETF